MHYQQFHATGRQLQSIHNLTLKLDEDANRQFLNQAFDLLIIKHNTMIASA